MKILIGTHVTIKPINFIEQYNLNNYTGVVTKINQSYKYPYEVNLCNGKKIWFNADELIMA